ncbi:alpha/beta fold hydrolase [Microbaculum marinisediminis]|uniref:Alpha/beta hydrolase n=1 Tax=Microbaculum marinisediminis TaxID=2931392 RepID=A0AAW5QZI1_9HYPH|nr:alpha/beta hydrolase [Microbaculum sp. A6E488]MCT8973410.1 alpha/beta hydrolase [Microbaculum sp. A6E488]
MSAPLFLFSGVGSDCRMFTPVIDRLKDDFAIVPWDMPGYGGKPLDDGFTFAGMADAVVEDMNRAGIARAVFLGHSIGGMLAQEIAARHPGRVAALILSGTTPVFGSPDGEFQKQFLAARLAPLDQGVTMPELAQSFAKDLLGSNPDPEAGPTATTLMSELPEQSYRAGLTCLVTFNRREELARIAVPTLLIAGEQDTNAPLKTMQRMAEKIRGARIETLPETGHLAPLECPGRFAEAVRRFLNDLP